MDEGRLYIVATPIGNLGDVTSRAVSTLAQVDFIAAEDTRVTSKLLNALGIKKPLVSCYRHNEQQRSDGILERIAAGESCALCCDAGTPAVSDPGEELVRRAAERGITVVPIPGPCAAIMALCSSGLVTGRFCFEGFLPMAKRNRRERLAELADERRTLIFYEAPHKLRSTLSDLLSALGDRRVTLARELTKLHEEIERTTLSAAVAEHELRAPRGEYVLVVEGAQPKASEPEREQDARKHALLRAQALRSQGMSASDACRAAAAEFGVRKGELYRELTRGCDE